MELFDDIRIQNLDPKCEKIESFEKDCNSFDKAE